ncbi:MAG TPA: hypothetical protein VMX13_00275 [Sedimentisphaerales bacterium]|nr:hypothetical protein [Sedimentisphaerales bacterium]
MRCKLILVAVTSVMLLGAGARQARCRESYEVLKVDFGCPRNDNTFKPGWIHWRLPGGCDGDAQASSVFWNVDETRINLELSTTGDSGMGNLRAGPGDQIANTYYTEARDIGRMLRDCCTERETSIAISIELTMSGPGLSPGEYILYSYHNLSRDRGNFENMFAITASGRGVTQLAPVCDVPIQHTRKDDELKPSEIRFRTDGSGPVTITYHASQTSAVLNAFEIRSLEPTKLARDPFPPDGATDIPPDITVSWTPGADSAGNVLYIGRDVKETIRDTIDDSETRVIDANSYRPKNLKMGETHYWRVDQVDKNNPDKFVHGRIWKFTVLDGKAHKPYPLDTAINVPSDVTLKWSAGYHARTHKVCFGKTPLDTYFYAEPVYEGPETSFKPPRLDKATTYYWRVDEVNGDTTVMGDAWSFITDGTLMLQVDLAIPKWGSSEPIPETAKPGWTIWADRRWADMYSHDGATLENAGGTPIDIRLTIGNDGMGALKAKGMRMYSMAGEGPPSGEPDGDPICNTFYQSADWASHSGESLEWGNTLLLFSDIPAGEYELYSYHNCFYHCDRYETSCLGTIKYRGFFMADAPEQGPLPVITALSLPPKPLPGYESWSMPAGTGKGVTAVKNAYNVHCQHVDRDAELSPSVVQFRTDGSPVLVVYEAPKLYIDYRDYPGGRAVLNAFRLIRVRP